MSFQRVRVSGAWIPNSVIHSAEFEAFDENISHAIDGHGGGAYAPQADLIIGGAPGVFFEVEIPSIFGNSVTMQENLTVAEDIICLGQVQTQRLEVNFDAVFDGIVDYHNDVTFHENVVIEDVFYVGPSADFFVYSGAGFYGNLYIGGDSLFEAPSTFNAAMQVNAPVTVGSGGHIKRRTFVASVSTPPGGVSPLDYDEVLLDTSSYPSGGVALIKDTGAEDDMAMTFIAKNAAPAALMAGATLLGYLAGSSGSTSGNAWQKRIEVRRKTGTWFVFDSTQA